MVSTPSKLMPTSDGLSDAAGKVEKFGADAIAWFRTGWETQVVPLANEVIHAAGKVLDDAVKGLEKDVIEKVEEVKATTDTIMAYGHEVQAPLVALAEKKGAGEADLAIALDSVGAVILAGLRELFPPLDQAPAHEHRKAVANAALTMFEEGFVSFLGMLGASEQHTSSIRVALGQIIPHIANVVVAIGAYLRIKMDFPSHLPFL